MLKWSPSHRKRTGASAASHSYGDVVRLRPSHGPAEVASADSSAAGQLLAPPGEGAPVTASLDRRKMVYRGRQPQRTRSASGIIQSRNKQMRANDGQTMATFNASSTHRIEMCT